ncbi:hypothetical protein GCM10010430_53390 [Kitasatospora cystarginea]|uniref:Uncharacterized protein n=1 Tax=Kitasatospora cystarginea TaxID=58350 RepID=A0ABN3EL81_9ACTN
MHVLTLVGHLPQGVAALPLGEPVEVEVAAPGGRRVLKAVRSLPALSRRKVGQRQLLPKEIDTRYLDAAVTELQRAATPLPKNTWPACPR